MNFNVIAGIGVGILFYNLTGFRFVAISISELLQLLNFAAFAAGSGEIDFQNKNIFLETWLIAIRNGDVLYGFTSIFLPNLVDPLLPLDTKIINPSI